AAAAGAVEQAIAAALDAGARTADLAGPGDPIIGTSAMGARIAELVLAGGPRSASRRQPNLVERS
ncbi:MAG: hypothetical protein ACREMN_03845, partial [Gemmatimonadales bacterium]